MPLSAFETGFFGKNSAISFEKIFKNDFSEEQYWVLVDKKLLYPLPRHSCKTDELFLKNNAHENIGTKKFNIAMNFANI